MQGQPAKIVSPIQERAILGSLATTRYPARDRVMFLLSMKAGLRAKAMASLTWAMVTDAQGQVAEVLHVPNRARCLREVLMYRGPPWPQPQTISETVLVDDLETEQLKCMPMEVRRLVPRGKNRCRVLRTS